MGESRNTGRMDVSRLVADALDPVLTARGFAAGQTASPSDDGHDPDQQGATHSGTVIWCAAWWEFQRSYPSLPQAYADGIGEDYQCVDLTVTTSGGRIAQIDLEGHSLAESFSALGRHEDARAADLLAGTPAEAVGGPLRELLDRLFETAARTAGP